MSNLVVFMNLTLDGVMQAPGRPARRGPARRLPARRLGATLQRPGHGQGGRGGHGQYRCHAAWATDVRGLLRLLAQAGQQPFTEVLNDTQEVRRLNDADRAAPMEQLHPARGRRRRGRGQAQAAAGQGPDGAGQRRADSVAAAARPRRPVRAADPPAGAGWGRRLFPDGGPSAALRLVDTTTTTTGVVIATYQPAEPTPGTST